MVMATMVLLVMALTVLEDETDETDVVGVGGDGIYVQCIVYSVSAGRSSGKIFFFKVKHQPPNHPTHP